MSSFSMLTLSSVITAATLIAGVGVIVSSLLKRSKCIVNCKICTGINRPRKEEIKSKSALYLIEILEVYPGISMEIALEWKVGESIVKSDSDSLFVSDLVSKLDKIRSGPGGVNVLIRWHAISMEEGLRLGRVLEDEIPQLDLHDYILGFGITSFGTRLFVAGGWRMSANDDNITSRVHSIDTCDTKRGWKESRFVVPRCDPQLVVFNDSLYAFGSGRGLDLDFDSQDSSRPWVEVYDVEHDVWKPAAFETSSKKLPSCILGDAMDTNGNLLLFSNDGVLCCHLDHRGRLVTKVMANLDIGKLDHHSPVLIGHCLYFYDRDQHIVKSYNLNDQRWLTVNIDEEEVKRKANAQDYGSELFCKLLPFGDDGFCMLKRFRFPNLIIREAEELLLVCLNYKVDGQNAYLVDASTLPIEFQYVNNAMLGVAPSGL